MTSAHSHSAVAEADPGRAPEAVFPGARPTPRPSRSALVIDDEVGITRLVSQCLGFVGVEATTANSGAEGIQVLRDASRHFDVALIDMCMPGDDGVSTIRQLRALQPDLPVVLLSGLGPEEVASRCAGIRLEGVMQKPFGLAKLAALVNDVLTQPRRTQ